MRIPLEPEYAKSKVKAQRLARQLRYTVFEDIVSGVGYNLRRNAVVLQLDEQAMRLRGVTMKDVEQALKHSKLKYSIADKSVSVTSGEEGIQSLEKLKDKLLAMKVKGVKRIKKTMVKYENGEYVILTDGSNLKEVIQIPGVDYRRVWTNNIHEIAEVFGIEAARAAIVREMKHVLDEQGLDVDIRHLMLLADMMTLNGSVKQVGRHGVVRLKSSPLARAAFEISVQTLLDAAVRGEIDWLRGNVERILIGKEILVGTGMVSLLMMYPGIADGGSGKEEKKS